MACANTKEVAIASNRYHSKVRSSQFQSLGYRQRASMHTVKSERFHKVWESARTANTGYHYRLIWGQLEASQTAICGVEDTEVATPWTPCRLNIALVIFWCGIDDHLCHD